MWVFFLISLYIVRPVNATRKISVIMDIPNATIGRIISVHAPAGTIPRRHVIHIYLKNDLPFLLRKAPTKTRCRASDDMIVTGIA